MHTHHLFLNEAKKKIAKIDNRWGSLQQVGKNKAVAHKISLSKSSIKLQLFLLPK